MKGLRFETEAEWEEFAAKRGVAVAEKPVKQKKVAVHASEHEEQKCVIEWAELNRAKWPQLGFLAAIPNGGNRQKRTAGMLKAEGVRSGYPDLVLNHPMGRYAGLFIELKSKTGKATENQLDWIANLIRAGNMALICMGAEEAIMVLEWYCKGAVDPGGPFVDAIREVMGRKL